MWNMFRCEMKKLLRCRAFYFLFLASVGCGALSVWVLNGDAPQMAEAQAAGGELLNYGYYAFMSAIGECGIEVVIGSLFAGIFICADFENHTISHAVAAGNSRLAVLLGKAFAYYIAVGILVLPYPILSGIGMTLSNGFGITFSGAVLFQIIRMLLFKVLISSAMLTLCVPLCFLIKKSGAAAAGGIFILMGGQIALSVNMGKGEGFMDVLYRYSPMGLLQMISKPELRGPDGIAALAVGLGMTAVLLWISWMIFKRIELK